MSGTRSDILGRGYGSAHAWRREEFARAGPGPAGGRVRRARYYCEDCGAEFPCEPDTLGGLFEVARRAGVPEDCPGVL